MILKNVLLLLPIMYFGAPGFSQTHNRIAAPIAFLTAPDTTTFLNTHPPIESILYNPAVYKKQVSRNVVQAIGNRQVAQANFIIHFRKEELHGTWQSFYNNGQPCDSGELARNLPTGEWKTWYPNGQLKTVRTYHAEKYQYVKADLHRNHPKDKRFAITHLGSRKAKSYFHPQYEGGAHQARSMLQKIQFNTAGDSQIYLPPFVSCLHHGPFVNYDEAGNGRDSGLYVNGLPHGLWKQWDANSSLQALGFYRHCVKHGQWKYYDGTGRLVYTERYNANGKRSNPHYFK